MGENSGFKAILSLTDNIPIIVSAENGWDLTADCFL